MKEKIVLAVDLGAESGRVMAVRFDGQSLKLAELHRFPNTTVNVRGALHWDFLRLWRDIQTGIDKGKSLNPAGIGVDTWGVDFGLLDAHGHLIGNPVHYRDSRTEGMMDKVFAHVPRAEVFEQTGIQFMPINTLYQMMSLVEHQSPQLMFADTFLTAPDLLNYWLTGRKVCEFSNATTTQMFNPRTGAWAANMLDRLGIPTHIFPEIVPPGTTLGAYEGIPVIAPACHDTGSAVAAVPTQTPDYAYISSGTWSLFGLEVTEPVISAAALAANVTNEGGVYGTYRLLKNVMGLWIIQQCRTAWQQQGQDYTYAELVQLALSAPPLRSLIAPNDPLFLPPGDHPAHIRAFCERTGQPAPETPGQIVRCVLESLALAYRDVLDRLLAVSGRKAEVIHIVGGGAQNELLSQMTANATGRPVVTGPIEATVIGNALVQLIALGELKDIGEARRLAAQVDPLKSYEPQALVEWEDAYERYKQL
ncbi:MAG: rhamnulokinase [Anaerolineaceae bacterium]|nr:rhamnulokinase [Anaerolineaceae bacterium]